MSHKERFGTAVWEAISELTDHRPWCTHKWVTVGEVAKKAGVSRNTAKKYLNILWEMGDVQSAVFDRTPAYRAKVISR